MTEIFQDGQNLQRFLAGLPQTELIDVIWVALLGTDVDWLRAKPSATIATELVARCSRADLIAHLDSRYPARGAEIAALTRGSNDPGARAPNWGALLRSPPETPAQWSNVLSTLPRGPAVELFLLPTYLVLRAANAHPGDAAPIMEAGQRVLTTLCPAQRGTPHLHVTLAADLGPVAMVPPKTYWTQAFSNACMKGPRMLGALILTMAPGPWTELEDDLADFITSLSK